MHQRPRYHDWHHPPAVHLIMSIETHAITPEYIHADSLFALIRDIYQTSDTMSESFEDKYPVPAALTKEIADVTQRPGALFLVAQQAGDPLGYLVIQPRHQAKLQHTADLHMGVHSRARGQGVGKKLIKEALATLEQTGVIELVYLMVRADNASAIHLYESVGFESLVTLHRDTRIDDRYYDGVLMRRLIQQPAH